ncbi:Xaa-Pro peptidase family protein [uncultured Brevibacillus sp.]|uniref:M24 family metallopeptidase n=1 Tax=uncultured Brevibacillus sp. TaxID=169970 RepID=UPI0025952E3B|nr:Xaa-Pro peptidase family protein [uncultured Brevibacillus sp.]
MRTDHRLAALREFMKEEGIRVSVIMNPDHQFYLTGFKALIYSRPIVLIVEEDKTSMIVPGLEEIHAKAVALVDEILVYYEHPEMADKGTDFRDKIIKVLSVYTKDAKVGIDLSFAAAELTNFIKNLGFEVTDVGRKIVKMRYVKDEAEIKRIEEAGRLVNLAVSSTLAASRAGVTEIEFDSVGTAALFSETANNYPNATLDMLVMSPSGTERTIMPHVFSNTRILQRGDVVIHTRQVVLNGYRAELERTVFIGEPSEQQRKAFEVMRLAQETAMEFIKPGVTARQVDKIARVVIHKEGLGEYAIHRVGHGIGISAHEEPYLRFDNDLVLEEGMVYTIEPGIYIPGLGGFRHSDTVVLTAGGYKLITEYPRDLDSLVFE